MDKIKEINDKINEVDRLDKKLNDVEKDNALHKLKEIDDRIHQADKIEEKLDQKEK